MTVTFATVVWKSAPMKVIMQSEPETMTIAPRRAL